MSDLYLILKRRLGDVTEWVYIDTATLREARKRKGLSMEAVARQLPMSAKTWERHEKAGRVPRHLVGRIAEVLSLEIVESEPQSQVRVEASSPRVDPQRDLELIRRDLRALAKTVTLMGQDMKLIREALGVPESGAEARPGPTRRLGRFEPQAQS